jgi:outer membrane lipopolysaccharide assembly protein LptE/RlpB
MVLIAFAAAGCGYRPIVDDSEALFGEGKTISIPIFTNKTYKPNLENVLANDLVDEFAKRKGLHIVESGAADYTLTGEVLSYGMLPLSYTRLDVVKEYRATMKVIATLRKNSTQRIIWKKEVSWYQDFSISADIAIQQNTEDVAIQEICRHLAQQIYLKTIEDF